MNSKLLTKLKIYAPFFSIPKYGLAVNFFQPEIIISDGFDVLLQFFLNKLFCEGFQKFVCNISFFNLTLTLYQISFKTFQLLGESATGLFCTMF